MADETTRVVDLPVKATSNISLADYLMGIDAAEGYQMLIGDLAQKIVETYTGSSLAGSAQTLKAALDGLNTKVGNATMGTTATSVTGAIAEHESDINGTNGINAKIGNAAMGTTATTLTGAIAEHEEDISELNSKLDKINILRISQANVSEETKLNSIKRAYEAGLIPTGKPFIGVLTSGSQNFICGYLYEASGGLYGAGLYTVYNDCSFFRVNNGSWAIV